MHWKILIHFLQNQQPPRRLLQVFLLLHWYARKQVGTMPMPGSFLILVPDSLRVMLLLSWFLVCDPWKHPQESPQTSESWWWSVTAGPTSPRKRTSLTSTIFPASRVVKRMSPSSTCALRTRATRTLLCGRRWSICNGTSRRKRRLSYRNYDGQNSTSKYYSS